MSAEELDALARALQRLRADNDWIQNYATFFFGALQRAGLKLDSRALQSLYRSHTLALFQPSLEAAHLGGCAVNPNLSNLQLRDAPSMPRPPAVANSR